MFRSLYARLALGLLVLLIAIGAVYTAITLTVVDNYTRQLNQEVNRHLARNIVADRNLVEEGRLNEAALKDTFMLYMSINPSIEIYLLDGTGQILSYSAEPGKIKRKSVSLEPIKAFLRMEDPYPLLGDDPRSHERQKAFSVTEIPGKTTPDGYLYVVLRGEQYDSVASVARTSYLLRMSGWAMFISLGLGLAVGLVAFYLLTRRLRALTERMEKFDNRLNHEAVPSVSHHKGDEVETLSITFDRLAERISQQIEMLKEQDALRRRLVAQVSHDLRTPLASMQGYLESLQIKKDTLSEDERDEFLRIALRQGRRLGLMLEELFELASLDARESVPQLEPFALPELIHDAVEKHRLKAESEGLSLNLTLSSDTPLAYGDIGMTERVLDNLLDNAIQHTPTSGTIAVTALTEGDNVTVSIRDDGPGISASNLKQIFEPFIRGDHAVKSDRHVGLGLAIAKRIMDIQNGTITAVNASAGQGSIFSFQLPLHRSGYTV